MPLRTIKSVLHQYADVVRKTDRLERGELAPVLLGVVGEIGSITTVAKKLHRESQAYVGFVSDAEEEFGDALWYLTALGQRIGLDVLARCLVLWSCEAQRTLQVASPRERDEALLALAYAGGALLHARSEPDQLQLKLSALVDAFVAAVVASGLDLSSIAQRNILKVSSRFLDPEPGSLPEFDRDSTKDEQLPRRFVVEVQERSNGRVWMRLNDVFIGDALTDNIADQDGYRFHDVFHFAYAAYLHWSPVTRALLKRKRKSNPQIDENEDGGRPIVVEEGISALVFARAKRLHYFEGHSSVAYDILKSIQQFVAGYEVDACPLRQWERAVLAGYDVFRQLKAQRQGAITIDLAQRSISFDRLRARR